MKESAKEKYKPKFCFASEKGERTVQGKRGFVKRTKFRTEIKGKGSRAFKREAHFLS